MYFYYVAYNGHNGGKVTANKSGVHSSYKLSAKVAQERVTSFLSEQYDYIVVTDIVEISEQEFHALFNKITLPN